MKSYSTTLLATLARRDGIVSKSLFWVRGRNRTTGAEEPIGVWTGDQDLSFTIRGQSRIYAGEGALLPIENLVVRAGVDVRLQRIVLNPIDPSVSYLVRALDIGLAPVEIHRAMFDPLTGQLIEEPHRVWKGYVDQSPITTPEIGGVAMVELTLASSARALQRGLTLVKSDAVQQLRSGDRFRQYGDVSGSVKIWWGADRSDGEVFAPKAPVPEAPIREDR